MNGEDLKFLAERASTLEDRTPVRLEEIHGRIAVAHRRRVVGTLAGAACLVVALVVALQIVTRAPGDSSPEPAPNPLPERSGTMPEPGTCWNVPPESAVSEDYWFDDSAQVSCTDPHTTETAQVLELTEPTIAEAEDEAVLCGEYVRTYVGVDFQSWVPWGGSAFLPSKEQIADGASWLRCDVVFPGAGWDYDPVRTITVPVEGLADDPPGDFWACFDEPPSTTSKSPFVPCDRPHAYEETGTLASFLRLNEYPSAAELAAAAREQCREGVPEGYPDVALTAVWDPRDAFRPGAEVAGACFMYRADGTPLPAR
jgi:hypothetical protein